MTERWLCARGWLPARRRAGPPAIAMTKFFKAAYGGGSIVDLLGIHLILLLMPPYRHLSALASGLTAVRSWVRSWVRPARPATDR